MAIDFIRFNPKDSLACVKNLWLITNPRRSRQKHISLKNIEERKQQWLRPWSYYNLAWIDCMIETTRLELGNSLCYELACKNKFCIVTKMYTSLNFISPATGR